MNYLRLWPSEKAPLLFPMTDAALTGNQIAQKFSAQLKLTIGAGMASWLVGLLVWSQQASDLLATVGLLLSLAILINVPLALRLILTAAPTTVWLHWALRLHPIAALAGVGLLTTFLGWAPQTFAVPLALIWLLFAGLLGLHALVQLPTWSQRQTPQRLQLIAMLFLPIGAAWLVAFCAGLQPIGFTGIIVLLTAVHFHFTGFAATIWASMLGMHLHTIITSQRTHRLYAWAATGFVSATPLIALGITLSPLVEIVGVFLLTASLITLAFLLYRHGLPQIENRWAQELLAISPLAMIVAIALAVLYGVGEYMQVPLITIPRMVQWHGWLNAVGFTCLGLVGWTLASIDKGS